MAGYNSIGAYDATTRIPAFKGLMQYGDEIDGDPCYATEEKNMETFAGVLQPAAACVLMTPELSYPIDTLMRLHRRWHSGADKDILVAASHGKLYSMLPNASSWTELGMASGISAYTNDHWSWVTYEINLPHDAYDNTATYDVGDFCEYSDKYYRCIVAISTAEEFTAAHWTETDNGSIDVLLISNADDGMFMIRGDIMTVTAVTTHKKFGVIERYAERIWGGAIKDDPDMLVYSAPYDPTDWEENVTIPEDGAGSVNQPSWDGDSFTALRAFGSQLIAFKRTRVWRILGTDPGEYTFKEQYGGGAPYEKTISVDNERILMLDREGVVAYDGLAVAPFFQPYCEKLWRRLSVSYLNNATSILWKQKYYLAVPLDNSTINNAVIIYDQVDNTWLLREDVSVQDFLGTEDTLYFTSSTTPGKVWKWQENSWLHNATTAATKWVGPWNDLSAKSIVKGGWEVYLLGEVKTTPVTLNISIQTEKKIKTKKYQIKPLTEQEINNNKSAKQKKIHFGGSGRRFRLIIESPENTAQWRLISGIMIVSEIDPD